MAKFYSGTSKYHAKKTFVDGIKFDSKREAARYLELKALEKAGIIKNLERQIPYVLLEGVPGPEGKKLRPMKYIADFRYEDSSGNIITEDSKGFLTKEYKIKKRLMWQLLGINVIEV